MIKHFKTQSADRNGLGKILSSFTQKRVAVLGDLGVDRYTHGIVERISPEAPVPIVQVEREELKLGLAANVADNIAAMGGNAALVGFIGNDRAGEDFLGLLDRAKISPQGVLKNPSRRTSLKDRIVSETQQLLRVDYESLEPITPSQGNEILRALDTALGQAQALIVEDYAKGLISEKLAREATALARSKKIPTLVDPNLKTPLEFYEGATLITPNKKEAEFLSGIPIRDESTLFQAGKKIQSASGIQNVVITLGREGMALFESGNDSALLIPTFAREVFDVSGAGDTVIAVLALALSSGAKLSEAALLANLAAGVEVSKRGTATVSPDEVIAAMARFGI